MDYELLLDRQGSHQVILFFAYCYSPLSLK